MLFARLSLKEIMSQFVENFLNSSINLTLFVSPLLEFSLCPLTLYKVVTRSVCHYTLMKTACLSKTLVNIP